MDTYSLLDVPRCRYYDQRYAERQSAPPLHPHPPVAPPPLSPPACRPFLSLPPARCRLSESNHVSLIILNLSEVIRTSSLGLMLYSILSAFSLSWRLSIIARRSLEALFYKKMRGCRKWRKQINLRYILSTWWSTFQTEHRQEIKEIHLWIFFLCRVSFWYDYF